MNKETVNLKKESRLGGPKDIGDLRSTFIRWRFGYPIVNTRIRMIKKILVEMERTRLSS